MDQTFWLDQLTKAKALVDAVDAAIIALTTTSIQSYELDTGQSKQRVTRLDLEQLQVMYDSALNRVATLEARLYGCGNITARPAW